jgi:hypothetical protein
MKKIDITNLLSQKDGIITIDKYRILKYHWDDTNGMLNLNKGKYDLLKLCFSEQYGDIQKDYNLESRTEIEILEEIKQLTKLHYEQIVEFLNGNKILPSNW